MKHLNCSLSCILSQEAPVFSCPLKRIKGTQGTGAATQERGGGHLQEASRAPDTGVSLFPSEQSRRTWERAIRDPEFHRISATLEFIKGRFTQLGKNLEMKW